MDVFMYKHHDLLSYRQVQCVWIGLAQMRGLHLKLVHISQLDQWLCGGEHSFTTEKVKNSYENKGRLYKVIGSLGARRLGGIQNSLAPRTCSTWV